jgi:hypothetical protein
MDVGEVSDRKLGRDKRAHVWRSQMTTRIVVDQLSMSGSALLH